MNSRIKAVVRAAVAWRQHTLGSLLRPFGKALLDAIDQLTPEDLAECGVEQYDDTLPLYEDGTPSREWPEVGE